MPRDREQWPPALAHLLTAHSSATLKQVKELTIAMLDNDDLTCYNNYTKMNFLIYSERLEYILELIKKERLSSPARLAEKFDCSKKTILRKIDRLKEKGHSITYCVRGIKNIF